MQFLFKVIIFFLIVFNFRVPGFYHSTVVAIVLSSFYYIYKRRSIPFTYFFQRYNVIILIGTAVLAFIVFLIAFLHTGEIIPFRLRRMGVEFTALWAIVYVLPLFVEEKESTAFEELAVIMCYAYALQGIIGLIAYLYPPLVDILIQVKTDLFVTRYGEGEGMNAFRLYNLSGIVYVELTAGFGVAFMTFFWLQLKSNHPYMSGWKKYIVFIFILWGTIMAGRTGFIGLLMGLGVWLLFSFAGVFLFFKKNISYLISSTLIILFVYNFILTGKQRQSVNEEVLPFAFEWYYKHRDYGKYEIASMSDTPAHYYYLSDETLLKGHGIDAFGGKSIYPHSDAGYMNTLVYGGIPLLICLIIYQLLYAVPPIAVALKNNSRNNRINCCFFTMFFLYIFIVEVKAAAVGYMYNIEVMYLALGSGYLMQYYSQKEQGELFTG